RPVVNVGEVQLHPVFEADFISATDLPKASHARFHAKTTSLPQLVAGNFLRKRRPRAHQAHVAAQDVKNLWQFVDTSSADDLADSGDPRVARGFKDRPIHFV